MIIVLPKMTAMMVIWRDINEDDLSRGLIQEITL